MILQGVLRRDLYATPPWAYSGHAVLPEGRIWHIQARVVEEAGHRYFVLEFQLAPGFSAAELEAVLVECERCAAERARAEISAGGLLSSDELPF